MTAAPPELSIEDAPVAADLAVLATGVFEYGRAQAIGGDARPLACFARQHGAVVAGASGRTEFERLFIAHVWVAEALRGRGLGSRIVTSLEDAARRRGCRDALIETLDERSAALYARLGYRPLATIENYVGPFTRHVMRKPL